jgi:sec-independent protein translocase protein TatB
MFNIGAGEFLTLCLLALVLIGPDKLPTVAADAARLLKRARAMAQSATAELRENMGPGFENLQVEDLHPKKLIAKQISAIGEMSEMANESKLELTEINKNAKIDPDLL